MNEAQRKHTITEITRLNDSKERLGKNLKFLGLSMLLDIVLMAACGIVEIKFR